MAKMAAVVVVEPNKEPYVKEIDNSLASLQAEVGGYIESHEYNGLSLIVNEEGKLDGLPENRPLLTPEGEVYDVVVGTFLVINYDEEGEHVSVSNLQIELAKKYFSLNAGRFNARF